MASYTRRRQRRLYGARIAIAAGVIVALIGLYFIVGISADTNRKNAECTEELTGTVVESAASGSGYSTTVEYTPGYSPMTVTFKTKDRHEVGEEIPVMVHPTSFTRVYVEGMSPTGKDDVIQGVIFVAGGAVLAALGIVLEKARKAKKTPAELPGEPQQ